MKNIFLLFLFVISTPIFAQNLPSTPDTFLQIHAIKIVGLTHTKKHIVLRELSIHQGDSINKENLQSEILKNTTRIDNLQLFDNIKNNITYISKDSIDIEISLEESFTWGSDINANLVDRSINVWWREYNARFNRINFSTGLWNNNVLGRHQTFEINLQTGFTKSINLSYEMPNIGRKSKNGLALSVYYGTGKEMFYGIENNKQVFYRNDASIVYSKFNALTEYNFRPKYYASHKFTLGFTNWFIKDELYALNNYILGLGNTTLKLLDVNYILQYKNLNVLNYPTSGLQYKITLGNKIALLSNTSNINQPHLEVFASYYKPLIHNFYLQLVTRGKVLGNANSIFVMNNNMGFSGNFVRGYEYYVINSNYFGIVRTELKNKIYGTIFNSPKWLPRGLPSFSMPSKIYAKVFSDYGYANYPNAPISDLSNKLLASVGTGFDLVVSGLGTMRIEYTVNRLQQKGLYLHFITL